MNRLTCLVVRKPSSLPVKLMTRRHHMDTLSCCISVLMTHSRQFANRTTPEQAQISIISPEAREKTEANVKDEHVEVNEHKTQERYSSSSQSLWQWLSSLMTENVLLFGFLVVSVGYWWSPVIKLVAQKQYKNYQRRKSFEIAKPQAPKVEFKRKEKEEAWKQFIYSSLLNSCITWVYGANQIGKSTELQKNTYTLQRDLKRKNISNLDSYLWTTKRGTTNAKVLYINLKDTDNNRANAEARVDDLIEQIRENARNGILSLVVVGMLLKFVNFDEIFVCCF